MIKAILFDFDGTLLNTNELIIQTFMTVLSEKFPGQFSREDCLQFIGPSLHETFSKLTPGEEDQMIAKYREWNLAHHDELVTEYDDVVATLEQLKLQGIRLAIVSTKQRASIERGLRVLGATQLFEVKVGIDDVTNVKPHPEPIFLALEQLGVGKDDVLMVGDNSHDIEGGHRAGVKTVGVAWSIKGVTFLQQYHPHFIIEHMSDLLHIVKGV